jgi:TatA/E family protein of Tat protein translocase
MIANLFGGDGLIVIVVALVVLVGGSQLPKIARNVGLAGREFRKAQAEAEEEQAAKRAGQPQATLPQAGTTAVAPAPPMPAATPTPPAGTAAEATAAEGAITLTPAQLDALLRARAEQVKGESTN